MTAFDFHFVRAYKILGPAHRIGSPYQMREGIQLGDDICFLVAELYLLASEHIRQVGIIHLRLGDAAHPHPGRLILVALRLINEFRRGNFGIPIGKPRNLLGKNRLAQKAQQEHQAQNSSHNIII